MYSARVASANRPSHSSASISTRLSSVGRQNSSFTSTLSIQRRNRSFNRSLHSSQLVDEAQTHVVEDFGVPLPVLVTEVVTIQDRISEMSVRLSDSGWAWLVCGRRLFVWRYMMTSGPRILSSQCRELTLPPSDLAHKADLVCVFDSPSTNIPSAISVSPEGIIRYWANIAHEGSSIEITAELHGQECFSLTDAQPLGCVLATTTSTLAMVATAAVGGQSIITCHQLKIPQGVLTGIGRRMSSFIFGSLPVHSTESKLVKVVVADTDDDSKKILFVLTGSNLQKWLLSSQDADKLLYEFDVDRMVKENLIDSIWGREIHHVNQIQTWLIDMQLSEKGACILAAGTNLHTLPQLYYSIGFLDLDSPDMPTGFSQFIIPKFTARYQESEEESLLGYQFLLCQDTVYMYMDKIVYCMPVTSPADEPDKVEFRSAGDRILGAGTFDDTALFFSNNYGIVSLKPVVNVQDNMSTSSTADERIQSRLSESITLSLASPVSDFASDDKVSQLKEAFLLYCKQEQAESRNLLDRLFPVSSPNLADVESSLNVTIVTLSKDLIDDYPTSDPRWAESLPQDSINASSSLIVFRQLEDKEKAHLVYIAFLKDCGFWNRFTVTEERDMLIPTRLILREHAEKLLAALALRNLQIQFDSLINSAIKIVLQKRNTLPKGKLTHQDLFYREVSGIQDIVSALIECEEKTPTECSHQEIVNCIINVNTIIQTIFSEACQYQQSKINVYQMPPSEPDTEYISWMATTGSGGIRNLLIKQYEKTLNIIGQGVEAVETRSNLFQQLLNLADLVLNGYCVQLESISNTGEGEHYGLILQRYQADKTKLISPLLNAKQFDRATILAEKYCDFGILIQMCEMTNNEERLQRYMIQFSDKDFSDFVFKWYIKEGKRGKLLSQPVTQHGELERFLNQHRSLSWIHDIKMKKYEEAQSSLQNLALTEKDILAKKKTLLSLSKLSALASDQPADKIKTKVEELNKEQELILHQESLPAAVLGAFGFDPDNMKVMSPKELIEFYICSENEGSNEYDFKKALDLLQYMDKDANSEAELQNMKMQIWCSAILKDSWNNMDMNNPLEACQQTIFFKVVDLVFTEGSDLWKILLPLDTILQAEELGNLRENQEFRFLIQAGYERIRQLLS